MHLKLQENKRSYNWKGGVTMPHIHIQMYPGRDQKTKEIIAQKMQAALAEEMQADKKYFSVSIEDVAPENWQSQVEDNIKEKNLLISADF
jgi:phenylpyruvate tautomerase PptA (4-oxalocrotonate tautomerase family)